MIKTSCSSVRLGSLLTLGVSLGIALASGGCHSYKDLGIQSVRSNSADLQACMAELAGRNPSAKGSMLFLGALFFILFIGLIWGIWKIAALLIAWVWGLF